MLLLFIALLIVCSHPVISYYSYEKENISNRINSDFYNFEHNNTSNLNNSISIIEWQRNELNVPNNNRFDDKLLRIYYLRSFLNHEPLYFIHINRASCGELAIIFEYLADEMDIEYRSLRIDGHINQNNMNMDNHRWSETLLENDTWGIVDVGFNLSPVSHDKYEFTENRNLLFGHVAYLDEDGTWIDTTPNYVKNTTKLRVNVSNNGRPINNADIDVFLNYNNKSVPVIGRHINYQTNESGLAEFYLGMYENVTYNIVVTKYFWQKDNLYVPCETIN